MSQVLILTKNILAEQEIQKKLQSLNYEVYCSAKTFDYCSDQKKGLDLLHFFQYVILSETICESEVRKLIPLLRGYTKFIIRKVEKHDTEKEVDTYNPEGLDGVIASNDSMDELRERFYALKVNSAKPNLLSKDNNPYENKENDRELLSVLHRLSPTEIKVLSILMQAENRVVTRDEMCRKVWNDSITKSHLASLSSIVSRLKTKFERINSARPAIQTFWGRGYQIDYGLFDLLKNEEWLISRIDFQ